MIAKTIGALIISIGVIAARAGQPETVAAVLIAEAGGEAQPRKAMQAVLEVIQHRAKNEEQGAYKVVRAVHQFSCLNKTTIDDLIARARRHKQWKMAMRLAIHGTQSNWTNGADHYHEMSVKPKWADPAKRTAHVGRHVFYKLAK